MTGIFDFKQVQANIKYIEHLKLILVMHINIYHKTEKVQSKCGSRDTKITREGERVDRALSFMRDTCSK